MKLNTKVYLPKALETKIESEMHIRTQLYKETFEEYKRKHCDEHGKQTQGLKKSQIRGVMKLKKKVKEGKIVICRTDKTDKMAALSRESYLAAGKEHTSKDVETTREECEERQRTLNGHQSSWLKITGNGRNWRHESRFRSMTINKSAAIPPLYCLIKDHKAVGEGGIPRTRPVVSGNLGMNVHLNNHLSDLIEPIANLARESCKAISTEESLRILDDTNKTLLNNPSTREQSDPTTRDTNKTPPNNPSTREERGPTTREHNETTKPSRCTCKPDKPTDEPTQVKCRKIVSIKSWLRKNSTPDNRSNIATNTNSGGPVKQPEDNPKQQINLTQDQSAVNHNDSNTPDNRTHSGPNEPSEDPHQQQHQQASNAPQQAGEEGAPRSRTPEGVNGKANIIPLQIDGLTVVGADVVGLYPNLNADITAEAIRLEVVESEAKFEGVNYFEAGKYIAINTQPWEARKMGVENLIPRRRYNRGPKPKITGEGSMSNGTDDDSQWVRKNKTFSDSEKAKLMGACLKIGTKAVFDNHCYKFGPKLYKQVYGGPTGLRITGGGAEVRMLRWARELLRILEKVVLKYTLYMYM